MSRMLQNSQFFVCYGFYSHLHFINLPCKHFKLVFNQITAYSVTGDDSQTLLL